MSLCGFNLRIEASRLFVEKIRQPFRSIASVFRGAIGVNRFLLCAYSMSVLYVCSRMFPYLLKMRENVSDKSCSRIDFLKFLYRKSKSTWDFDLLVNHFVTTSISTILSQRSICYLFSNSKRRIHVVLLSMKIHSSTLKNYIHLET